MGFPSIAHVPVIFLSSGQYGRIENRYLRERATGDWFPHNGRPYPSRNTLKKTAYCLLNFHSWMDHNGQSLNTVDYDDVLSYQRAQIVGTWSKAGRPLSSSFANQRADEVTHFLTWAALRGLRPAFDVKRFFAHRGYSGDARPPGMVRAGRAKTDAGAQSSTSFVLPTIPEAQSWLARLKTSKGTAKYLACRCILEVGLRRHELTALKVEQWPSAETIHEALRRNQTSVPLSLYVTKGSSARIAEVPMQLAIKIRNWIDEKRPTYEYRFLKVHNSSKPVALFLSDHPLAHGNPLSEMTIYRSFTQVKPAPSGWTPHKGRHFFACYFILSALELEARPHGGLSAMGADWAMHRGEFWLSMLKDQLGHKTSATVNSYLRWLITSAGISNLTTAYHNLLMGDGEDE